MYIKRHIEKVINDCAQDYPVILLTGPRQVGKSTVLRNLYPNINYETLDNPFLWQNIKEDPVGYLKAMATPSVFDEVQKVPELFTSIKYMVDIKREDGMYFLTGSQKFQLMNDVSESLAGRVAVIEMLGLSSREIYNDEFDLPFIPSEEYLLSRNSKIPSDSDTLWQRIHRGGMPRLHERPHLKWAHYYEDYLNTYLERDVQNLEQVGDILSFFQLMTALASRTGELLNMDALARDIGVSLPTIKRWIAILQKSNIVFLLQPFSLNVGKRVIKTPKVYFTDTGLVCYLCKWSSPEVLKNGAMAGQIYETFVVNEIIKSYYNAGLEPSLYYFRTTNGQEIDLIFYQDGTIYPVEIKKTSSPSLKDIKHFHLLNDYFPSLKIGEGGVICSYEKLLPLGKGNKVIPISFI